MSAVGLPLVAAGLLFIVMGFDTHDQIREELKEEMVVTSDDAVMPGVLVDDAETAKAQAGVIKEHTLGTWSLYSELAHGRPATSVVHGRRGPAHGTAHGGDGVRPCRDNHSRVSS